jgi:hypothetical protein
MDVDGITNDSVGLLLKVVVKQFSQRMITVTTIVCVNFLDPKVLNAKYTNHKLMLVQAILNCFEQEIMDIKYS